MIITTDLKQTIGVIHALLDVKSQILDAIQNKQKIALLLMEIRKAFVTVSHKILEFKKCIVNEYVDMCINCSKVILLNPRLFVDDTRLIVHNSTLSGLEHECNRER